MNFAPVLKILLDLKDMVWTWLSPNLIWLELVSVLISGLLLWGIIYIVTKVNYFDIKAERYIDILGKGNITQRRSLKGWEQIRKRILSSEQQDWKLAVLEADKILDEILKMAGYLGSDLDKKLEILNHENLQSIDDVRNAHTLAVKILRDPTMEIKKDDAIIALKKYKKAFEELNLLEK
ncbi:MAG: hypothetical protein M1155_01540 [Patescibacteria group bacterium]|nr:hypothetical protein [Patescibacteria group bacterium]